MKKLNSKVELLAKGFRLLEGVRVDENNRLYFSEIYPGGDSSPGVYRWNPDGRIETLIPGRAAGGLCLNEGGGVVASGQGLLYWDEKTGKSRSIVSEIESSPGGLNDLQPDKEGRVYVGWVKFDESSETPNKVIPGDLLRVDPDGKVTTLAEGCTMVANGIGFSPDGKRLYLADYLGHMTAGDVSEPVRGQILVFDVQPDGSLKNKRVFVEFPKGQSDGLTVDSKGGVISPLVGEGAVVRFNPDGSLDWQLDLPTKFPVTVEFGGPDFRDLYILSADGWDLVHPQPDIPDSMKTKGAIWRTRVEIPGMPCPKTRFSL